MPILVSQKSADNVYYVTLRLKKRLAGGVELNVLLD